MLFAGIPLGVNVILHMYTTIVHMLLAIYMLDWITFFQVSVVMVAIILSQFLL